RWILPPSSLRCPNPPSTTRCETTTKRSRQQVPISSRLQATTTQGSPDSASVLVPGRHPDLVLLTGVDDDELTHHPLVLVQEHMAVVHIRQVRVRSEEHTSELQSRFDIVCRLLLEKKKTIIK